MIKFVIMYRAGFYFEAGLFGSSDFAQDLQTRDSGFFKCQSCRRVPIPKQRLQVGLPHFLHSPPLDEPNSLPQLWHFHGIICFINLTTHRRVRRERTEDLQVLSRTSFPIAGASLIYVGLHNRLQSRFRWLFLVPQYVHGNRAGHVFIGIAPE